MQWTLIMGGLWQLYASYKGWNVSATHCIIGGIIGFAFAAKGPSGVLWAQPDPDSFPPYKGIVPIVLSWFIAPVLSAIASMIIFTTIRALVLRHQNAQERSLWVLPPLVFFTVFINIYFIFTKGAKKLMQKQGDWNDSKAAWISVVVAASCALVVTAFIPMIRKAAHKKVERRNSKAMKKSVSAASSLGGETPEEEGLELTTGGDGDAKEEVASTRDKLSDTMHSLTKKLTYGMTVDIHEIVVTDARVAEIHKDAEVFDERAEQVFAYLQVFSAICVMFAHGAAEVSKQL